MSDTTQLKTAIARRLFLQKTAGFSLGSVALEMLQAAGAEDGNGRDDLPHHRPRARNVIFLTQSGGPSQIELFDHKPQLR